VAKARTKREQPLKSPDAVSAYTSTAAAGKASLGDVSSSKTTTTANNAGEEVRAIGAVQSLWLAVQLSGLE
jgi:hypothetical protein